MSREIIEDLEERISNVVNFLENNTKNSLEKIEILAKANELVFWLQMYQDKYYGEE